MLRHSRVRLSGCLGDVRPLLLHTNTTARSYAQLAQAQVSAHARRPSKKEGTIEEVFTKLTTEGPPLPPRFADLKKEIVRENAMNNKEAIVQSWRAVLTELEGAMEEIAGRRNEMILQVSYQDVERGLSQEQLKALKKTGLLIVKGGVSKEEAFGWLQSLKEYVSANTDKVKGAPADKIVFYEIYNSRP